MQRQLTLPVWGSKELGRFWAKVEKGGDCWTWKGAKNPHGYGKVKWQGKIYFAHRIAFAITNGDPGELIVRHSCDNPSCVNPAHLLSGKPVDNALDTAERNRGYVTQPKPVPGFPLTRHPTGRWCKKVRGKVVYFGKIEGDENGQKALDKWLAEKDYLIAGRKPPIVNPEGLTVAKAVNYFLSVKRDAVTTGELSPRTFEGYRRTGVHVVDAFGRDRLVDDLKPADFTALRAKIAKGRGPVSLSNEIRHVRILFKYVADAELIERPLKFGPDFKPPAKRLLRQARNAAGPKMFEADEIRRMIESAAKPIPCRRYKPKTDKRKSSPATHPMAAFVLLGINAGFGQTDCASLPMTAIDLDAGFIDFPRPKTAIPRRVPLWPETVAAIRTGLGNRPRHRDAADEEIAFLTRSRRRWVRMRPVVKPERGKPEFVPVDSVAQLFGDLIAAVGIEARGRSFYSLRRTFETIAGESRDQVAVDHIMGHADDSMAAVYRQRIDDSRLRAVVDHVHAWLFGE